MEQYYVHGIQVSLGSNWSDLLRLVELNYRYFREPQDVEESIDVDVALRRKAWLPHPQGKHEWLPGEEGLGTGLSRIEQTATAILRSGSLRVEFAAGDEARVQAWYQMDRKARILGLVRQSPTWEACQKVMRLALHQPLFHMLEQRGIILIHAVALARKGEAVLIAGLNGSGKSTLGFNLLDHYHYMSDNFVLFDGKEVLGFPEAIRLPAGTYRTTKEPVVYGKALHPVSKERTVVRAKPKTLVVLSLSSETSITQLSPQEAAHRLIQIHDMTHEFPRYNYLGMLSRDDGKSSLRRLTESVESFSLKMSDTDTAGEKVLGLS